MDWNYWLGRKYGNLDEQTAIEASRARTGQYTAETGRLTGTADAALANVRAGLLPAQTDAEIARMNAEEGRIREETKYIGPLADSSISLNSANAYQSRASGRYYGSQADTTDSLNRLIPRGYGWSNENEERLRGYFGRGPRFGLSRFSASGN